MGCSAGWFVAGLVGATSLLAAGLAGAAEISFDRDVRPILAEHCFACHGPDAGSRAAELRLDLREGALADRDGVRAVVPGNGGASELVTRIRSTDPDVIMPPPETNKPLTAAE
jgi:mono/diheme cytochrome c family protein